MHGNKEMQGVGTDKEAIKRRKKKQVKQIEKEEQSEEVLV